jgi:hypothetical protein
MIDESLVMRSDRGLELKDMLQHKGGVVGWDRRARGGSQRSENESPLNETHIDITPGFPIPRSVGKQRVKVVGDDKVTDTTVAPRKQLKPGKCLLYKKGGGWHKLGSYL